MAYADRGVVKAPNEAFRGDRRANGYIPLLGVQGITRTLELDEGVSRPNGWNLSTEEASPVRPPDHTFHIAAVNVYADPCADAPGTGAISIEPIEATTKLINEAPFLKAAQA